jgi:hypothetical protein
MRQQIPNNFKTSIARRNFEQVSSINAHGKCQPKCRYLLYEDSAHHTVSPAKCAACKAPSMRRFRLSAKHEEAALWGRHFLQAPSLSLDKDLSHCETLCELSTGTCLFVYILLDLPMTMNMLQQIVLLSHVPFPHIGQSRKKSCFQCIAPDVHIIP